MDWLFFYPIFDPMPPVINQYTFLFLIGSLLSAVVGIILIPISYRKNRSNKWLAAYFIIAGYGLFVSFILYARLISEPPWFHLYRTGYIAAFLLMPASYLYIRNLLRQTRFRRSDLVHFIPVLVFIVDMFPFYLAPSADKIAQVLADEKVLNTGWRTFSQGWMGIGSLYLPVRLILSTLYWVLQLRIIWQSRQVRSGDTLMQENKVLIRWAKIFCGTQVFIFLPYYLIILLGAKNFLYLASHAFAALSCALSTVALLLNPEIMYGLRGVLVKSAEPATLPVEPAIVADTPEINPATNADELAETEEFEMSVKPRQMNYISRDKLEKINELMLDYLQSHQPFLKKGYSSGQLAADLKIQPYLVSAVINQLHQTNFNDFLNGYRILHVLSLMQKGESKMLTLEALAGTCGFNNRNSFTTAFKKQTGTTPGTYVRTLLQTTES